MSALEEAILRAGSQGKLAEKLGVHQTTISVWLREKRVPAEHCPAIQLATGIPKEQLRPDIFKD